MKILISGGKTGGHLVPGIALYSAFKSTGADCYYILSQSDKKFPVTSRLDPDKSFYIDLQGLSRKLSIKTPLYILKLIRAFFKVVGVVKKINPDAVVITGGYISNPVALSAVILGKPLFVCEQNSVAGVTNRFYSRFSKKVFTTFPETRKVPQKKTVLTGNPSLFVDKSDRKTAAAHFQLDPGKPIIAVTGGSQGARRVNQAVTAALDALLSGGRSVIWGMGASDYDKLKTSGGLSGLTAGRPGLRIYPFIERMDLLFSCSDCVIARSGASTLMEIIRYHVPSVLVPIFQSPDDHQRLNALLVTGNGGGILLEEPSLNAEALVHGVEKILENNDQYRSALSALGSAYYSQSPENLITTAVLDHIKNK